MLMKTLTILLFLISQSASAGDIKASCFIYKEGDKTTSEGGCLTRYPPQSTFKIVLALIGFNEGILIDENHPVLPFEKSFSGNIEACKAAQTPASWMKNSCVWFSQAVTKKLGMKKFKKYVSDLYYGNQDVQGTKRKPQGPMGSWISSSLKISPKEQIEFMEKILTGRFEIKSSAINHTKNVLYQENLDKGWSLYGKTGTGDLINADGSHNKNWERGWFVGWIERENVRIYFAHYKEVQNIKMNNSFNYIASKKAKTEAIEKLKALIVSRS